MTAFCIDGTAVSERVGFAFCVGGGKTPSRGRSKVPSTAVVLELDDPNSSGILAERNAITTYRDIRHIESDRPWSRGDERRGTKASEDLKMSARIQRHGYM